MSAITEETGGAFTNSSSDTGSPDMHFLLGHCPRSNAFFDEALRITNSSASFRNAISDTRIGSKVLIPYRQLHFNKNVWGADADELDPGRFLNGKNLRRNPSYRPFRGGSTYCPGRFVARQEVLTFVACTLRRFRIRLVGESGGPPNLDQWKPCIGAMGPVAGADLLLRVEERELS